MKQTVDFNDLRFSIGDWYVGNFEGSEGGAYGICNNRIGNNKTTWFSITSKWKYIKLSLVQSSELAYDYFFLNKDGTTILNMRNKSSYTFEMEFDGTESTLQFCYRKDSSGTSGYDRVCITELIVETVDNELVGQTYFLLKENETNFLYNLDENNELIKISDSYLDLTYDTLSTIPKNQASLLNYLIDNDNINYSLISIATLSPNVEVQIMTEPLIIYETVANTNLPEYVMGISALQFTTTNIEESSENQVYTAIEIAPGQWIVNDMTNETDYKIYTDEELTPDLLREKGLTQNEFTPLSNLFSSMMQNRYFKIAFLIEARDKNSIPIINDYIGAYTMEDTIDEEEL